METDNRGDGDMDCSTCWKRFFCITACPEINEKLSRIEDVLRLKEKGQFRESAGEERILSQMLLHRTIKLK